MNDRLCFYFGLTVMRFAGGNINCVPIYAVLIYLREMWKILFFSFFKQKNAFKISVTAFDV